MLFFCRFIRCFSFRRSASNFFRSAGLNLRLYLRYERKYLERRGAEDGRIDGWSPEATEEAVRRHKLTAPWCFDDLE